MRKIPGVVRLALVSVLLSGGLTAVAAAPCGALPLPEGMPVGSSPCPGVRPGGDVDGCTLNFLFFGSDGERYMGTAGHCIIDGLGPDRTWEPGQGPVARTHGERIGEFAYAVSLPPSDFAAIRLDDGVEASPAMCHWGGPTGINDDHTSDPVVLRHYGRGLLFGSTLVTVPGFEGIAPARTALQPTMMPQRELTSVGLTMPGDSGSPVIDAGGRAVGVLSGYTSAPVVTVRTERLQPLLDRAEAFTGIQLVIQTAPPAS